MKETGRKMSPKQTENVRINVGGQDERGRSTAVCVCVGGGGDR